jgi:hypothetical protein
MPSAYDLLLISLLRKIQHRHRLPRRVAAVVEVLLDGRARDFCGHAEAQRSVLERVFVVRFRVVRRENDVFIDVDEMINHCFS